MTYWTVIYGVCLKYYVSKEQYLWSILHYGTVHYTLFYGKEKCTVGYGTAEYTVLYSEKKRLQYMLQ